MKVKLPSLSKKQHDAIEQVVIEDFKKQLAQYNYESMIQILHILRFKWGFGQVRLKRFVKQLTSMQETQLKRYELKETDTPWLCEKQLRESGIDLDSLITKE